MNTKLLINPIDKTCTISFNSYKNQKAPTALRGSRVHILVIYEKYARFGANTANLSSNFSRNTLLRLIRQDYTKTIFLSSGYDSCSAYSLEMPDRCYLPLRHSSIFLWLPERRIFGTRNFLPLYSKTSGRVYTSSDAVRFSSSDIMS